MTMRLLLVLVMVLGFGSQVQAQAVARAVTANDLKSIQIFMEAASAESGKLPDAATTLAALQMDKGSANLVKLVTDGVIVLTGTGSREEVWAYEKSALEKGGLMLSSNGIDRVTAADLKKRLGK